MNFNRRAVRLGRAACAVTLACALTTGTLPAFAGTAESENLRGGGLSEPIAPETSDASGAEGATESSTNASGDTAQFSQQVPLDQPSNENENESAPAQPAGTSDVSGQVAGTVVLPADANAVSIVSDGLVFEIDDMSKTATLVGSAATPPKGDLLVPASVTSGTTTYEVTALAKSAFVKCGELTSISLPATLREVDPDALMGCTSLTSITISAKSEAFASLHGMLFTKDYSRLLLIPEGMEGAANIPGSTTTVPAQALSRCYLMGSSLTAGDGSAAFETLNGMLFTKDLKTLVSCPPASGNAVVLPAETEVIGEYALAGCKDLTSIAALGNVHEIDPTAFADEAKASAVVALLAGEDYDTRKSVWEQAGFQHFAEPAEPGATSRPEPDAEVASGLVCTLLNDYTLSVTWEGAEDPTADLEIPASAEINGVSYRVSTIAANAFANHGSLTSVKLPASITSIGEAAFAGCANLTDIQLPGNLREIGERAFEATGLTDIWLPASVQVIGSRAFASCDSLTRIVALGTPQVADDVLAGCANLSLYCPYDEANTYPWNLGLLANNNHLLPYGLNVSEEPLHLEVGQSANLFDNGLAEAPEPLEVSYSYAAKPISVAPDGTVTAKAPGTSEVTAILTLNNQELTRITRTVEVVAALVTPDPEAPAPPNTSTSPDSSSNNPPINETHTLASVEEPSNNAALTTLILEDESTISLTAALTTGESFTATSPSGHSLSYKVLAETDTPSVEVSAVKSVSGRLEGSSNHLIIPSFVTNDGITYAVTKVAADGFKEVQGFSSVSFAPGDDGHTKVTTLGDWAFARCYDLVSFDMPLSVTTLNNYTFAYCYSLNSLVIPDSVNSVGTGVTINCSQLRHVTLGKGITALGIQMFEGCPSLESLVALGEIDTFGANLFRFTYPADLVVYVPSAHNRDVWLNASLGLTPDNVHATESAALLTVTFDAAGGSPAQMVAPVPAGARVGRPDVSRSGYGLEGWFTEQGVKWNFENPVTENMTLQARWVEEIQDAALGLKFRPLPDGTLSVVAIDPSAVRGDVVIPATYEVDGRSLTVSEVGEFAFHQAVNLRSVTIPNTVRTLQVRSFYGCSSLENVVFQKGSVLEMLETDVFGQCTSLERISLPDSLISLKRGTFGNCSKLQAVEFGPGSNLKVIGNQSLIHCTSLQEFAFPASVERVEYAAFYNTPLTSIDLPEGVRIIDMRAFYACKDLTTANLPPTLTFIGQEAFSGSGLRSITLPAGLQELGAGVFKDCASLSAIFAPSSFTGVGIAEAFDDTAKVSATVVLPAVSQDGKNEPYANMETAWGSYNFTKFSTNNGDLPTEGETTDGRWELTTDGTLRIWCERSGAVIQELGWSNGAVPARHWDSLRPLVTCIKMDSSINAVNMNYWFSNMTSLEDASGVFIPEGVSSVSGLFSKSSIPSMPDSCARLSGIANVSKMFMGCQNLATLSQEFTSLAEGVNAEKMFMGCSALKSLPDSFTLPNTMASCNEVFSGCSSLVSLPASFRLPKSVSASSGFNNLFWKCSLLTALPEGFTMDCDESVKNLDGMFYGCSSLTLLPSGFQMAPYAYEAISMFNGCTSLFALPDGFTLASGLRTMTNMFLNCTSLASLPDTFEFPTDPNQIDSSGVFSVDSDRTAVPMYYNGPDDRVMSYPWASVNRVLYTSANKPATAKTITLNVKEEGEPGAGSYWTTAYTDASGKLAEPAAPSRAGYVFTLWYADEACTQRADFTKPFDADTTVYGKLAPGSRGGELPCEANSGAAAWSLADDGTLYIRGNGIINGMGWGDSNYDTVTNYWAPYRSLIVKASMSPSVRARGVPYWFYGCNNLSDVSEFRIPEEVWTCVGTFWGCSSLATLPEGFSLPTGISHTSSMFRDTGLVLVPSTLKMPVSLNNASKMFMGCVSLAALPNDFGFAGCKAYIGNAFTNCISLTSLPTGFTFPDNWIGDPSIQSFYCDIEPGEPRVPLYYEGSNPDVLNYDWESQNRTLITNEDDAESSGMRQITLKVQSPDEEAGFPWETRSTVWTNRQGVLADQGAPTALDGYAFTGWCTDEACLTLIDFSQPVPAGVDTLYGKWIIAGGFNEKLPLVENTTGDVWWRITADGTLSIQGEGDVADLGWNTSTCTQGYWGPYRSDVKRIEMGEGVRARIMNAWFAQMDNLTDVSGFRIPGNTEEAQDLFQTCTALERVPEGFRLPESMRMATGLFAECTNLKELPESFVLPPNLVYANWMFNNCHSLSSLPAGFFIPKTTTRLNFMFQNCTALTSLPEGFEFEDPPSIVNLEYMFNGCSNLVYLPASLKTTELSAGAKETMGYSFKVGGNTPLETYYAGDPANLEGPSEGYWATQNRTLTTTVPAGKTFVELQVPNKETGVYETWMRVLADAGAVITEPSVPLREGVTFVGWWTGASLETRFDFATQTVPADGLVLCAKYYNHSGALPTVNVLDNQDQSVAGWSLSDDGTLHITCSKGETIANLGWTNVKGGEGVYYTEEYWAPLRANVKRVQMDPSVDAQSMAFWFADMTSLSDATGIFVPATGNMLSLQGTFVNSAVSSLPDGFTIPEGVLSTEVMFYGCADLRTLPESFRLPSTLITAVGMFSQIKYSSVSFAGTGLRSLPADFTIPDGITGISDMFYGCSLETLPVGLTIPSKATNAHAMFFNCGNLKALPGGFRLGNLVDISNMFQGCGSLTVLPDGFTMPDSVVLAHSAFQGLGIYTLPTSFVFGENSKISDAGALFLGCENLVSLPASFKLKHLLDRKDDQKVDATGMFTVREGLNGLNTYYAGDLAELAPTGSDPVSYWSNWRRSLQVIDETNPLPEDTYQVVFNLTKPGGTAPGEWMTVMASAASTSAASASAAVAVPNLDAPKEFGYVFSGWRTQDGTAVDLSQPVDPSLFTEGRLHLFGTYTLTVSFTVPTSARVTIDASGTVTPAPVVFESRTPVALALDGVEGSLASGAVLLFPNEAERNAVGVKLHAGGDSISLPLNGTSKRLSLDLAAATASTPATLDAAIAIDRNGAQINFQPGEDMATFAKLTWTIVPRG